MSSGSIVSFILGYLGMGILTVVTLEEGQARKSNEIDLNDGVDTLGLGVMIFFWPLIWIGGIVYGLGLFVRHLVYGGKNDNGD